ncbi:MAG: hypothetical protein D6732_03495 [Methanobacteriota archaeon]|nr:MAG: hypothetical protein D6732_03495 [Euryarchaeota archaeon]
MRELEFLERMNSDLLALERELFIEDVAEDFPNIYILGLSRSGTTLAYQVLCNYLDVRFPNALVARFWKTPLVGFSLSNILLGGTKDFNFSSYYGQPTTIFSPHEYSWFWHRLLRIRDFPIGLKNYLSSDRVDWTHVKQTIININMATGKATVYKPLELIGYRLERYADILRKSFFVYLERDAVDIACSLAKARIDKFGNLDCWWGSYPVEYEYLQDSPWDEQIAGQVIYLRNMYEEKFELIDQSRLLRIGYSELCGNPNGLLDEVVDRVADVSGYKLEKVGHPAPFRASKPSVDPRIRRKLIEALDCFYDRNKGTSDV